jgi:flagellar biosynthetic protein FliP
MTRASWVRSLVLAAGLATMAAASVAATATPSPASPIQLGGALSAAETSSALRVFLALTALSLIPAALICMTSFVRIVVVLSMLRHAVGLTETPPNMVIVSLALFLTLFSMSPVLERINNDAVQPFLAAKPIAVKDAVERGKAPIKEFMVRQTREPDLMLMVELSGAKTPASVDDIEMVQLVPAFMMSELRAAFQIGFVIYLPFLLIDIVVASVLMSLGMMMVPPATIAIPLKILLFVLIDGWNIVVRALMGTFH